MNTSQTIREIYEGTGAPWAMDMPHPALSRGEIMKQHFGPFLDGILRPIYVPELSSFERISLPRVERFVDLEAFADALVLGSHQWKPLPNESSREHAGLLQRRILNSRSVIPVANGEQRREFPYLNGLSRLTFYNKLSGVVDEGLRTGVVVPLTVASQIFALESQSSWGQFEQQEFPVKDIGEIMRRPSFDRILQRLTKGPNGFLGEKAVDLRVDSPTFFAIGETHSELHALRVRSAYEVDDSGKVVDLSKKYHVQAAVRRNHIAENFTHTVDTSGCPVRHTTESPEGETQESLIITAKKFLIGALEVSTQKSQGVAQSITAGAES